MKRFYKEVTTAPADDGWRILLDGRPVRTPAQQPLALPTAALADAIAAEWRAQDETVRPHSMPLTRLATTVIDRMPAERAAAIDEIAAYARTDLLCYRAAEPFDLVQRQTRVWQPLLDWAASALDARLEVTTAMVAVPQPEAAVARLRGLAEALDDWALIGLHAATTALGSIVLGLALLQGRLDAEEALRVSLLDELFEIERWGSDTEIERRHAALRRDVVAAGRFLAATGHGSGAPA